MFISKKDTLTRKLKTVLAYFIQMLTRSFTDVLMRSIIRFIWRNSSDKLFVCFWPVLFGQWLDNFEVRDAWNTFALILRMILILPSEHLRSSSHRTLSITGLKMSLASNDSVDEDACARSTCIVSVTNTSFSNRLSNYRFCFKNIIKYFINFNKCVLQSRLAG